ncbi:glycosyltransferase family 2 protein [Porphyromonas somerae]|uniref:glycosyltransferase family 2 protein n=1 Tax=Porphyromonas somerae TaxID=322095 RepID=UPI0039C5E915
MEENKCSLDLTILIPLFNEEESLPELHEWISRVVSKMGVSYEILFINDGSTDGSWKVIKELRSKDPRVVAVSFNRNYGKSPGLQVGFTKSRGEVVITMDADLQDSPDEIPELYRMIKEEGYDVVSGWKKKRYDPLSKTLPTKLFNATVRLFSGIPLHDFNCGLKSYHWRVVKNIEVYNDMHRFLPYMAKQAGFHKIGEKVVQHRPRKYGHTKFGMSRFVNGYLDLLVLWFTGRFGRKPMHFFGLWGSVMFLIGFIALVVLAVHKLVALRSGVPARLITDLPYFYVCLVAIILGVQLFLAGFIGELLARQSPTRNHYIIDEEI